MTGFDRDFLSGIEKNEIQPQLGTVIKLSKALDSAFGRLVSGVGEKLYSITRKSERRTVSRSTSKKSKRQLYTYKSLGSRCEGASHGVLDCSVGRGPRQRDFGA